MKKIYLSLLLLVFLSSNIIYAQICPESLGPQSTANTIHFKITSGTCSSYPLKIFVAHGNYSESFTKGNCNGTNLYYHTDGAALPVVDSFNFFSPQTGLCQYLNGVLVTLSDKEVSLSEKVFIYPNPLINDNHLNIKFKSNLSAKLDMYNLSGKLVLTTTANNQDRMEVNTSRLSNGVYTVKISTDDASTTRKVVIMK